MFVLRLSAYRILDCHVFDCGPAADDVLATVGQVFTIMIEKKKPRSASIQPSDEAMNPSVFGGRWPLRVPERGWRWSTCAQEQGMRAPVL